MRMRLDKYLSDTLGLSRREAKQLLREGRVLVDGQSAARGETQLDPAQAAVTLDGRSLAAPTGFYLMLHKPAGVLTATRDSAQPTVLDLLPPEYRHRQPFPVGRLDKDTTGLLLLTDDGDFAHRLIAPKSHVSKLYEAELAAALSASDVAAFEAGLTLRDGTQCLPARLELLGDRLVRVEVYEGRYHQVRRMLASRGAPVLTLRRLRIGGLWLDATLMEGACRMLREREIELALSAK